MAYGEAQPGAAVLALEGGSVDLPETLEEPGLLLGRHADARVLHHELQGARGR